jgi:hypothetical protein
MNDFPRFFFCQHSTHLFFVKFLFQKGLQTVLEESNELKVPLMGLVNYRGFRLASVSLLPIKGGKLVYGR